MAKSGSEPDGVRVRMLRHPKVGTLWVSCQMINCIINPGVVCQPCCSEPVLAPCQQDLEQGTHEVSCRMVNLNVVCLWHCLEPVLVVPYPQEPEAEPMLAPCPQEPEVGGAH
eukprot:1161411-Pelagomonas_calceolata.AAC.4